MDRLALKIKLFASHLLIIALFSTFVVCPVFAEETFTESQQIVKEVLSESEDITGTSEESDITIDTEVISVLSEDEVSKKIVADPVQIDADLVTYQDHSGIAIAQGSVKVRVSSRNDETVTTLGTAAPAAGGITSIRPPRTRSI